MLAQIEEYVPSLTAAAEIHAFGIPAAQHFGVRSWSLRQLTTQDQVWSEPKFVAALRTLISEELGARAAYAPQFCGWSARLLTGTTLTYKVVLRDGVLFIKQAPGQVVSGLFLQPGEILLLNPDGDPLVIAQGGGFLVVARAGCGALVDPAAVREKKRSHRDHPSIVDALVAEFGRRGVRPEHIRAHLLFPSMGCTFRFAEKRYYRPLAEYVQKQWPNAITMNDERATILPDWIFTDQAMEAGITNCSCMSASEPLSLTSNLIAIKRNA